MTVSHRAHLDRCNGACLAGAPRGVARGARPRGAACSSASTGPSVAVPALARATANAADSAGLTVVGRGSWPGPPAGGVDVPGHHWIALRNWVARAPSRGAVRGSGGGRARPRGAPGRHHSEERGGVRGLTVAVEGQGNPVCCGSRSTRCPPVAHAALGELARGAPRTGPKSHCKQRKSPAPPPAFK